MKVTAVKINTIRRVIDRVTLWTIAVPEINAMIVNTNNGQTFNKKDNTERLYFLKDRLWLKKTKKTLTKMQNRLW